jgi:hypothetical protein
MLVPRLPQRTTNWLQYPLSPKVPHERRQPTRSDQGRVHPRGVVADAEAGREPEQEHSDPICAGIFGELDSRKGDKAHCSGVETGQQSEDDRGQHIRDP